GALPPNSKDSFFKVEPDCAIKMRPTSVEPVNVSLAMFGWVHRCSPKIFECVLGITCITCAGILASLASCAKANALKGVSLAGLHTTVQPAAKAGAIFLASIALGKFQGVIQAATPIGCTIVLVRFPCWGDGIILP